MTSANTVALIMPRLYLLSKMRRWLSTGGQARRSFALCMEHCTCGNLDPSMAGWAKRRWRCAGVFLSTDKPHSPKKKHQREGKHHLIVNDDKLREPLALVSETVSGLRHFQWNRSFGSQKYTLMRDTVFCYLVFFAQSANSC